MGKFRGLDKDEGWIKRRFAKIEKQMREDRAAKRLAASTIGAGGLTIKDGGSFVSKYSNGIEAVRIGPLADGTGHALMLTDEDDIQVFLAYRDVTHDAAGLLGTADFVSLRAVNNALTPPVLTGQVYLDGTQMNLWSAQFISLTGATGGVQITHSTTGSAANTVLDAVTGLVSRSTSSLRYKQDVEDAEVDPAAVLDMQPRTWRDKAEVEKDPDTETRYVGFIAEELHDLGLGQFVVYDTGGDPEAISYDRLTVALLAVLKDQEKRIAALEADDA